VTLAEQISADRDTYFNDWGKTVSYTQTRRNETSSITAIFTNEFELVDLVDHQVETMTPELIVKDEDAPYLEDGDKIVRNGVTYYVRGIRPDGYGLTTLMLSKD